MANFTNRKYGPEIKDFSFLWLKSWNVNIYMIIFFLWRVQILFHISPFEGGGGGGGTDRYRNWGVGLARKREKLKKEKEKKDEDKTT
jgi:hypothetical protein